MSIQVPHSYSQDEFSETKSDSITNVTKIPKWLPIGPRLTPTRSPTSMIWFLLTARTPHLPSLCGGPYIARGSFRSPSHILQH